MKDKLIARLSEVLDRDLTGVEKAIVEWTIVHVTVENLRESN